MVVVVVVVVLVLVLVVRTFVLHEGVCPATRTLVPNSGGRTPGASSGVPATPSRRDGSCQPWPCACAHGPKKSPTQLHRAATVFSTSAPEN